MNRLWTRRSTSCASAARVVDPRCAQGVLLRLDETAEHFLLRLLPSLQPVGTIRASRSDSGGAPYYRLSRLAVLKDFRKLNFGRELVLAYHKWVAADAQSRGEHPVKLVCNSVVEANAFYAK